VLTKRTKLFVVGCFSLGLLACIVGASSLAWYKKSTECFKDRPPLSRFVLTIDQDEQKLLIEQSQKFADRHGFKFDIAYYTPQGNDFLIDMTRKDIEVTISNTSFDLNKFYVGFYNYDCIHPTVVSDIVDLEDDLKSFINEIPKVMITAVHKSLRITMDKSHREELLSQIRNLADEHSLEFTLSFSSDKTVFHSEIHGESFHVIIDPVPTLGSSGEILITFFIDYYKFPTPTSLDALDELFNELKSALSENPDVTITEEK